MHAFRIRRSWLWLAAACLLLLLVAGVVFFFREAPDGSEEVLERVQIGMSEQEVENFLYAKRIRFAGYRMQPAGLIAEFRNYTVFFDFDEEKLGAKARVKNRGAWNEQKLVAKTRVRNRDPWYDVVLSYFQRIRRKLGV
jgi:hypothetical protein